MGPLRACADGISPSYPSYLPFLSLKKQNITKINTPQNITYAAKWILPRLSPVPVTDEISHLRAPGMNSTSRYLLGEQGATQQQFTVLQSWYAKVSPISPLQA